MTSAISELYRRLQLTGTLRNPTIEQCNWVESFIKTNLHFVSHVDLLHRASQLALERSMPPATAPQVPSMPSVHLAVQVFTVITTSLTGAEQWQASASQLL